MYCSKCGQEINDDALICPHCGCGTANYIKDQAKAEARAAVLQHQQKQRSIALLLCFFLGGLGAHRFYVGKIGTGILWLVTLGFWGIGTIVDFIMILCDHFTDGQGYPLYHEYPGGVSKEEYEAASATPRKVRQIALVIVLIVFIVCFFINFVGPVVANLFYR